MKLLEIKLRKVPDHYKDCMLVEDEMSLKPKIEYDIKTKTIIGLASIPPSHTSHPERKRKNKNTKEIEVGSGLFKNIATHAKTYILCGVGGEHWKQVIGHDFTGSSFDAVIGAERVVGILKASYKAGARCRAYIADQGTCNKGV